jgi:hypothetical protein
MLKFLARMVDTVNHVSTEFFIEPAGAAGARQQSKTRHLIARSSDGRPEFAAAVPDSWSDDEVLRLVNGQLPPDANR